MASFKQDTSFKLVTFSSNLLLTLSKLWHLALCVHPLQLFSVVSGVSAVEVSLLVPTCEVFDELALAL